MNSLFILFIIIAACAGAFFLFYNTETIQNKSSISSFDELEEFIRTDISKATSASAYGMGLSLADAQKQNIQIENMRQHVQNSSSGDRGARNAVQQMVKQRIYAYVKEQDLDSISPFEPGRVSAWTMFETLIYTNDSGRENGETFLNDDGFSRLIEKHDISDIFTLEQLKNAYELEYMGLDYEDKINIITQIIFAETYGLGILDTLNYQSAGVEEIQAGVNGPQSRAYDYRQEIITAKKNKALKCAKDSTEIIYKGNLIKLPFLGFKTDAEMQRVIRNLLSNSGEGELTEATPRIVADTIDNRRITAARGPQSDAWAVWIRKYDTLKEVNIKENYKDELLTDTICLLTRAGAHIAVTGEMETGKTTLLRSIVAATDEKPIRCIENEAFELNCRLYFPERNIAAFRVTQELDEESVLAFVRKTTGHIFVIGEVNSLNMANLCNKLSKISRQVLFSAHYTSTQSMVSDFKNAKLCNGFSNERLAEIEAVAGLNIDIHVVNKKGHRYIPYINEVRLTEDGFEVYPILEYNAKEKRYIKKRKPSKELYEKAYDTMTEEEYQKFIEFFDSFNDFVEETEKDILLKNVPGWVTEEFNG